MLLTMALASGGGAHLGVEVDAVVTRASIGVSLTFCCAAVLLGAVFPRGLPSSYGQSARVATALALTRPLAGARVRRRRRAARQGCLSKRCRQKSPRLRSRRPARRAR